MPKVADVALVEIGGPRGRTEAAFVEFEDRTVVFVSPEAYRDYYIAKGARESVDIPMTLHAPELKATMKRLPPPEMSVEDEMERLERSIDPRLRLALR